MKNPNHPKKGATIKVEPIRDKKAIKRIKKLIESNPRDYCLFVLGINTALRANELLSIRVKQVQNLKAGDDFELMQTKVNKYKRVTLNSASVEAINMLLKSHKWDSEEDFLFFGRKGSLRVPTVNAIIKKLCKDVGLPGNYGSHSLRKTWGYWQRVECGTSVPLLMEAFGHSSQRQTLSYLGIQAKEIREIYAALEL